MSSWRFIEWLYGWHCYWRAVYKSMTKKHGAKGQPFKIAASMGQHYRFIVYGQNYPNSRSFRQIQSLLRR